VRYGVKPATEATPAMAAEAAAAWSATLAPREKPATKIRAPA